MKKAKRFLKYIFGFLVTVVFIIYFAFYEFTKPKSDNSILSEFTNHKIIPKIEHKIFEKFKFRQLSLLVNDTLPTIVFVHGTIGSLIDFKEYMKDTTLSKKANFISYDRVGYNYKDKNDVQESIAFERNVLQHITKPLDRLNTIIVGYSYGGPIALADFNTYKATVLIAPAIYSKVEPMPWLINFYKWKMTRWIVPPIWQKASKEKLSHQIDLKNFENNWKQNPNKIITIHGNDDSIVPYANSEYLVSHFSGKEIELVNIPNAGHALVWTEFKVIKEQLLKVLY